MKSKVAILKTSPATVLADYHRLMNLAGYQDVIAKDQGHRAQGQHQLALLLPRQFHNALAVGGRHPCAEDRQLNPDLIHACHNRTVVIDAHFGERQKINRSTSSKRTSCAVHLYEGEDWINVRDAVRRSGG